MKRLASLTRSCAVFVRLRGDATGDEGNDTFNQLSFLRIARWFNVLLLLFELDNQSSYMVSKPNGILSILTGQIMKVDRASEVSS